MAKQFLQISVGIDIAKDDFKVCLMGRLADQQRKTIASSRFKNRLTGFESLVKWVDKHRQKYSLQAGFLMEATGVYHENLAWFLYQQARSVFIVLPNQAKAFFKSEGFKSKNDQIDAKGLAQMALSKPLKPWKPISPLLHSLRTLTRQHASLQKEFTRTSNQLHALEHSHHPQELVVAQLKQVLLLLREQMQTIKTHIEELTQKDAKLHQKLNHLTSIQGVGLLSACVVVAETNGFELFTSRKQLCSFAGYDVVEKQSGQYYGKTRISKKGNSHIRRILYMPAFQVVLREEHFNKVYQRIYQKTKLKMKAYTAVQRKLLCLMYTLWKKEEDFEVTKINKQVVEGQNAPLPEITQA